MNALKMPPAVMAMLFLAACGDSSSSNNDTVWTGLSGVIIFGVIAVIVVHMLKKRGK